MRTVYDEPVLRRSDAALVLAGPESLLTKRSGAGFRTYVSFVKPHIDLTFVLVAVTGSVLARVHPGPVPLGRLLGVAGAVALLSAGAECWTNLLDRDIDAVMRRTARRSLPTGVIGVRSATALGALLTASGLVLAATIGLLPFIFLLFALFDNVVIYSALTKRSTPWSIVLGAAVGPLTLWAGYAAVSEPISAPACLIGAMVAAWVPVHVWAIATRHRDDYSRARVPMAPVVWGRRQIAISLLVSCLAMGAFAVAGLAAIAGPAATWVAGAVALLSVLVTAGAVLLPWRQRLASPLIHLATAYLVLVLLSAIGLAL
jgi:protoheme IX farnesyltransferase